MWTLQRRWAGNHSVAKIYIEHYDSETDLFYVSTSFTGNHTGLYSARQQQFIYPPVYSSIELAESSAIVFLSTYQNSAQLSGMGDAYGNVIIAPQFSSIQMINQRPDAFVAGKRMNDKILYGLLDFQETSLFPFATILSLIQIIGTISTSSPLLKTGAGSDR